MSGTPPSSSVAEQPPVQQVFAEFEARLVCSCWTCSLLFFFLVSVTSLPRIPRLERICHVGDLLVHTDGEFGCSTWAETSDSTTAPQPRARGRPAIAMLSCLFSGSNVIL